MGKKRWEGTTAKQRQEYARKTFRIRLKKLSKEKRSEIRAQLLKHAGRSGVRNIRRAAVRPSPRKRLTVQNPQAESVGRRARESRLNERRQRHRGDTGRPQAAPFLGPPGQKPVV